MKFEIYESKQLEEKGPVIRLALEKVTDGGLEEVNVVVVDNAGRRIPCGVLIRFTPDGRILRCCAVSRSFGFRLNPLGQIKVVK